MGHRHNLLMAVALLAASVDARAALFVVNSNEDAVDAVLDGVCETAGSQVCTLRAAIQEANFVSGPDTIVVPADTYTLAISGRGEDQGATGDLDVGGDLVIMGAAADTTIIDGAQLDRVFDNLSGALDISNVTIRNGNPGSGATDGGGIRNFGTLFLTDVTLSGNKAGSGGGGLDNVLTATLTRVTISGNMAGLLGGGILNDGDLALTNVTVNGNVAGTAGGGIQTVGTVTLINVTLSNNTGGGLDNAGTATAQSSIFADNPSNQNCTCSPPDSAGNNLDSANTCALTGTGDLHDMAPLLGPLQDNGGPTFTRALMAGSPAIDAGSADCPPPDTDQRSISRPQPAGGQCDIGAFELEQGAGTTTTIVTSTTTSTSETTTTTIGSTTSTSETTTTMIGSTTSTSETTTTMIGSTTSTSETTTTMIGSTTSTSETTTTMIGSTTSTSETTTTMIGSTTSTSETTTTMIGSTTSTSETTTTIGSTTSTSETTTTTIVTSSTTSTSRVTMTTVAGSSTTSTSRTTTTTLPPCPLAGLPAIECELAQLAAEVETSVPPGTVHDALAARLSKAMTRIGQAVTAAAEGNAKREKKALTKAAKALKKFEARLRTKKARIQVPPAVSTALQTSAEQLRTSILSLRGTL